MTQLVNTDRIFMAQHGDAIWIVEATIGRRPACKVKLTASVMPAYRAEGDRLAPWRTVPHAIRRAARHQLIKED